MLEVRKPIAWTYCVRVFMFSVLFFIILKRKGELLCHMSIATSVTMDLNLLNSRLTPELTDEELGKKEIRKFLFEGDMRVLSLTTSKGLSDALSAIITELEEKNAGLAIIQRFAQALHDKRQQTRKCFW